MKVMVLLSGGVDSTTALGMAIDKYGYENVIALSIFYGQKHKKELESAKNVAAYYKVEHIILDLKKIFEYSDCSLLEGSSKEILEESYESQIKKQNGKPVETYVPFRNGLFLSSAASIALSKGASLIYYGAHADDACGNAYPDCSEAFNKAMGDAIYIGSGNELKLVGPFVGISKSDVVSIGLKLHVPYHLTWSCYEGHDKACGRCATCLDRKKAFLKNGVVDPIEYEE